jgi:hypothetical protein
MCNAQHSRRKSHSTVLTYYMQLIMLKICIPALRTTILSRAIFVTSTIIHVDSGIETKIINFNNLIIRSILTIFTRFCLKNLITSNANICARHVYDLYNIRPCYWLLYFFINVINLCKREASFSIGSAFLLYILQQLLLMMTLLVETCSKFL